MSRCGLCSEEPLIDTKGWLVCASSGGAFCVNSCLFVVQLPPFAIS